jgi:hypothetical protein
MPMPQMQVGQVDMQTGELLEGATLAVFYPKQKNGFQTGWLAMAQEPLMALAQADLGDQARRVLFAALARLDFENYMSLNQAELGRLLGMPASNVSRAITRLVEEGVIVMGPKLHNRGTYTLNPHYGWKGSAKGHHNALMDRMRSRGMSVIQGGGGAASDIDPDTLPLFE